MGISRATVKVFPTPLFLPFVRDEAVFGFRYSYAQPQLTPRFGLSGLEWTTVDTVGDCQDPGREGSGSSRVQAAYLDGPSIGSWLMTGAGPWDTWYPLANYRCCETCCAASATLVSAWDWDFNWSTSQSRGDWSLATGIKPSMAV